MIGTGDIPLTNYWLIKFFYLESNLGLVYVIIPQSRSNVRSITHGMLFVHVDCLPSITGSEKKDGKKLAPGEIRTSARF